MEVHLVPTTLSRFQLETQDFFHPNLFYCRGETMHLGDRLLGHYRLVRRIGSGGMGEVYLAEDIRINRQVAIKVVHTEIEPRPDPVTTQDTKHLFQHEMRVITMLDHPHILPLFDFGEEKDGNGLITYMVMPYRQEGSLTDWLRKREDSERLTPNEVAHFAMQAADALQHAHDRHLIHQDVKPSNFLVRERSGNVLPDLLLMDFGIAKITTATVITSQNIRGTPVFMAPEQWEGEPQPATDQYALAVMAYQFLTGRTPFSGRMEQVMRQHFTVQPQPPSSFNPDISPTLDAVILRALEKQPDQRFPSILQFALAFQQALQASGNQGPIVLAPKKEEPFAVSDDAAELEKMSLVDSAPLSSTPLDPAKLGRLASTVAASNHPLSAQAPTVAGINTTSTIAGTPKPVDPRAVKKVSSRKKSVLPAPVKSLVVIAIVLALIILVIISNTIGAGINQNHTNPSTTLASVPTPTPTPTPTPPCTRYQLSISNMNVSAVSDGYGLGGTLETTWTFLVNDQAQTYAKDGLDVGVTDIGLTFLVDVPTYTSTITFSGSGKEHDVFSDDELPGFAQVWGQAQDWGLGTQSVSGKNSSITYTLNYQITCIQKTT
jgi:serine/threonine protein kinase